MTNAACDELARAGVELIGEPGHWDDFT